MANETTNRLYLTNNYSFVSKYSACVRGYFEDEKLLLFFETYPELKRLRSQLISRCYALRMKAVQNAIESLIDETDCIVILGGGYDTLPYRFQNRDIHLVEIDLGPVIDVKMKFFNDNETLFGTRYQELYCDTYTTEPYDKLHHKTKRATYSLISCDLRYASKLKECLNKLFQRCGEPNRVAFLNEVCLCYMDKNENVTVLKTLIEAMPKSCQNIHYVALQQVKPSWFHLDSTQHSEIISNHFYKMSYPLKYFPNERSIVIFFDNLGFHEGTTVRTLHQLYHEKILSVQDLNNYSTNRFDEYETMDSFLHHYAIIQASLHLPNFRTDYKCHKLHSSPTTIPELRRFQTDLSKIRKLNSSTRRYGHSCCSLDQNTLLISGGFGYDRLSGGDSKHRRLGDICISTLSEDGQSSFQNKMLKTADLPTNVRLDRMHGQLLRYNDLIFFEGGRQAPYSHNANNSNFCAMIKDDQLVCQTVSRTLETRWRHRVAQMNVAGSEPSLIRIGGLRYPYRSGVQGKISFIPLNNYPNEMILQIPEQLDNLFGRHSFGLAKRDETTLFCLGGLKSKAETGYEQRFEGNDKAFLWDLRDHQNAIRLEYHRINYYGANDYYDCDVHFINANQVIRLHGSAYELKSGYFNPSRNLAIYRAQSTMSLIDIRNMAEIQIHFYVDDFPDQTSSEPMIFDNCTTWYREQNNEIMTIGGGGNYFVFGTHFNHHSFAYKCE